MGDGILRALFDRILELHSVIKFDALRSRPGPVLSGPHANAMARLLGSDLDEKPEGTLEGRRAVRTRFWAL